MTGFADATGGFLPMVTTMNAAGILDLQARWLGVGHDELGVLALASEPGAGGVTLSPYYGAGHADWAKGVPTPFLPGPAQHVLQFSPKAER